MLVVFCTISACCQHCELWYCITTPCQFCWVLYCYMATVVVLTFEHPV
jgi:hypothetical protein